MRFHRRDGQPDAYLVWRIRLLGLAMVLALLGIGTGLNWVINVAIGVAVLGFLLRFFGGEERGVDDQGRDDDWSREGDGAPETDRRG